MSPREVDLAFELGWQPQIVAVEKGEETSLGALDRGLARQRRPAIAELTDQLDARITCGMALHHGSRLVGQDRKSTRLNSSHANISYAVFCLKQNSTSAK